MINKLKKILKGNEHGFTLIEMIVVVAISTFITAGLVLSLHSIMFGSNHAREEMRSTQYVQNSGSWLRQDVLMSQSIKSGDIPETPESEIITLYWTSPAYKDALDNDRIDYSDVNYYIDGEKLKRREYVITKISNSNGNLLDIITSLSTAVISDNVTELPRLPPSHLCRDGAPSSRPRSTPTPVCLRTNYSSPEAVVSVVLTPRLLTRVLQKSTY